MEGIELKNVSKQARDAGVDPQNLEAVMNFFRSKTDQPGEVTFSNPVRNIKGLTVSVLIRTIDEKKSDRTGKTYWDYRLMVCTFEDVVVPSDIGDKIDDGAIRMRVDKRTKMSPVERQEYLAGLSPADRAGFAGKREYRLTRDDTTVLYAGTEIKITSFDGPYTHSNNMPFVAGEFAIIKGLYCEETIKPGEQSYGRGWKVQSKGSLEEDTNKGPEDVHRMLRTLAKGNHLVNVGDNNPHFDMSNESESDRKFRQDKEQGGKDLKNWEKNTILLGFLPEHMRPAAARVIVIPLHGSEPDPEFIAQRDKVVVSEPTWSTEFAGTKNDDTPVKLGAFQAKCRIWTGDETTDALVQVQCFDKHMNRFGVMNTNIFAKIAASFVPRCHGYIAARMDVGSSHAMDESTLMANKQNEDGSYPKEVAFGVFAYAELLNINLASGVIAGGFGPITDECASTAMKLKYKSDDFSEQCPADVSSYATLNPLNTGGKPPIINLLESRHSVADLSKTHQFFLVCDKRNDSEEIVELMNKLQRKYADSIVQKMSDLIMGQAVKGISGWPVKLKGDIVFTVFAVRNSLVKSTHELLEGPKIDEAQFAEQYIAAMKKRKASEEKARVVQEEIDALHNLGAEAFEDPPAKRQKAAPEPPSAEDLSVVDEEEQETSASSRPKRRSRKKRAESDLM